MHVALSLLSSYKPMEYYERNPELKEVLDMIRDGAFCPEDRGHFKPIYDALVYDDRYALLADYEDYMRTQDKVAATYKVRSCRFPCELEWLSPKQANRADCGL